MLGFFPDPHPDELLYSVCSRYHERSGNRAKETTAHDLFGTGRAKVVVDFPSRLGHLVSQFPPGHSYTVERLIDENTMLPYYEPFLPPERACQLRLDMRDGDVGGGIHGRIGVLTSSLRLDYLRYCPACVAEDVRRCREPYWHRLHQAPGVVVCPEHAVFLETSDVSVLNRRNGEAFITAKRARGAETAAPRPVDPHNRDDRARLLIAQDVLWLMHSRVAAAELDSIRGRYFNLLTDRGLMSGRKVRKPELEVRFKEYYSPELLEALSCGLERHNHWLKRLWQDRRSTHPPLHHLLLMQCLGCSPEDFFNTPAEFPIAGQPLPQEKTARRTGCGKEAESPEVRAAKQAGYREQWKRAVKENPRIGRMSIKDKVPMAYNWLLKHDREWFEQNSPARLAPPGPPTLVDWGSRDAEFAAEVSSTYERLVSAPGRPIRASRTAIAREIGQLGAVYKSADKLPLTNKALDEYAESVEAYATRRVWWAAECFRRENVRANKWQLLTRAAVSYKIAAVPEVSAAFAAAVASLDPINEPVPANRVFEIAAV